MNNAVPAAIFTSCCRSTSKPLRRVAGFLDLWLLTLIAAACSANTAPPQPADESRPALPVATPAATVKPMPASLVADIVSVEASGQAQAYDFAVGIKSPDTGCDQYADWWEVLGRNGTLIYRRVLLHSHVDEQPFVRSGGPVPIAADHAVWVRAHMHPGGYGGQAFTGSVESGFRASDLDPAFAADVAGQPPLPEDCAF